jgi:hypothetical protein
LSDRAHDLYTAADQQIREMIEIVSAADEATLQRPCPGREQLGDGTIAALAAHTTDNYQRIGAFVATSDRMSARHGREQQDRHRISGFLRALGHTPPDNSQHAGGHGHNDYTADSASPPRIIQGLGAARQQLASIEGLTDRQLDEIPLKDSFRFCDGKRTLQQVLAGLLKHQRHQLQSIKAALTRTP